MWGHLYGTVSCEVLVCETSGVSGEAIQTRSVGYGQRVLVLSDLELDGHVQPARSAAQRLADLLGDLDDPAIVVIAGNFFAPVDALTETVASAWRAHPELRNAIATFCAKPDHDFILVPGARDHALRHDQGARALVEALGIEIVAHLRLDLKTASGSEKVEVVAGRVEAPGDDQYVVEHLDDPLSLPRFVTSRTLYRRFGAVLWLLLAGVLGWDLFNTMTRVVGLIIHHHYKVHAPHPEGLAGNVLLNLVILVVVEALAIIVINNAVRRRFRWRHAASESVFSEPLTLTRVGELDAIAFALESIAAGVSGVIVGGATRPALAYLDEGFCASPGPSRLVTTERDAALGLPSVFVDVQRFSVIELEAGASVNLRLSGSGVDVPSGTWLERLVMRGAVQPGLPDSDEIVGTWPDGQPFPANPTRLLDGRRQRSIRRWASGLLFLDGLITIISTTSPPLRSHLRVVLNYLPLGVAQSAAVVAAIAGVAMIMLARGIRRGQRRAWYVAQFTLAVTTVAHATRGGSVNSSVIAAGLFFFLLWQRRNFTAQTDRSSVAATLPRLALIALTAVFAATIGIEAADRNHPNLLLPSWPTVVVACAERLAGILVIRIPDRLSDFVDPVLLVIGISLFVTLLYVLSRPVVDRRLSAPGFSAERRVVEYRARDIVRRHGRGTLDYFALRDDKQFFFLRDSLVAYAVYGGIALLSPDPIGPEAERADVLAAFRSFAESHGWSIAVMAAGADWLPIYHAAGLHSLYLGDEAIVDIQNFTLEGGKMKGLRQACTRLARHGYTVEFCDPATIDPSQVSGVLDLVAMMRRGEDERGFSMMLGRLFDPKDKGLLMTIVRGPDGRPAAACQFVPSPAIKGFSLDLMRRDPGDHPNGLIDYALCSTIEHLRSQGAQGLSLNFSAFRSVLDGERGDGTWTKIERWTLLRISGVLPIATLWTFNAKYQPRWLPRHIVYPAIENFVPTVAAILRAESLTEIPVLGRFLANDPTNRPGTVVPPDVLAAAQAADQS